MELRLSAIVYNMNVDEVRGFCEGVAGIAALGFIIIKEFDQFAQRQRQRRSPPGWPSGPFGINNITSNMPDNFTITSHHPLTEVDDIGNLLGEAISNLMRAEGEGDSEYESNRATAGDAASTQNGPAVQTVD